MNGGPKPQSVRLLDVFALGPFMVWFALRAKGVPLWAVNVMVLAGLLTITYNARNYLIIAKEESTDES